MSERHRDPVDEAAAAVLRRLIRLDTQMESEGFSKSARLRAIGQALETAIGGAVDAGVLSMSGGEPYDTGGDVDTVNT